MLITDTVQLQGPWLVKQLFNPNCNTGDGSWKVLRDQIHIESKDLFEELGHMNSYGCSKCVEEWERYLDSEGISWERCKGCDNDCRVRTAADDEYRKISSIQLKVEEAVEGRDFPGLDE